MITVRHIIIAVTLAVLAGIFDHMMREDSERLCDRDPTYQGQC